MMTSSTVGFCSAFFGKDNKEATSYSKVILTNQNLHSHKTTEAFRLTVQNDKNTCLRSISQGNLILETALRLHCLNTKLSERSSSRSRNRYQRWSLTQLWLVQSNTAMEIIMFVNFGQSVGTFGPARSVASFVQNIFLN